MAAMSAQAQPRPPVCSGLPSGLAQGAHGGPPSCSPRRCLRQPHLTGVDVTHRGFQLGAAGPALSPGLVHVLSPSEGPGTVLSGFTYRLASWLPVRLSGSPAMWGAPRRGEEPSTRHTAVGTNGREGRLRMQGVSGSLWDAPRPPPLGTHAECGLHAVARFQ